MADVGMAMANAGLGQLAAPSIAVSARVTSIDSIEGHEAMI
jgi:hypothetical protein